MNFSRIDRRPVTITVTATEPGGALASLDAVDVALLPTWASVGDDTDWPLQIDLVNGQGDVLIAGPDAEDHQGALVLFNPASRLWIKDPAVDSTQAVPVEEFLHLI